MISLSITYFVNNIMQNTENKTTCAKLCKVNDCIMVYNDYQHENFGCGPKLWKFLSCFLTCNQLAFNSTCDNNHEPIKIIEI